jgi:hypothetical protein
MPSGRNSTIVLVFKNINLLIKCVRLGKVLIDVVLIQKNHQY